MNMDRSSRSLPPIRDIFGDALDGRHTGTSNQTTDLALRGSRSNQPTGTTQPSSYTPHGYGVTPHPPISLQYHPPPPTWSTMANAANSRHSSISTASVVSTRDSSSSASSASDTDDHMHVRRAGRGQNSTKNRKEKKHRADLGHAMQIKQYVLENYCGNVHGSEQSAGNAKSSGLNFNKLDIDNASIAVGAYAIDRLFKQALRDGTVEQLRAELQRVQVEYLEQPGDVKDPTYGTLMHIGHRCFSNVSGSCFSHGQADVNQCRRAKAREGFNRNVEFYVQENGPGSKKRRQA